MAVLCTTRAVGSARLTNDVRSAARRCPPCALIDEERQRGRKRERLRRALGTQCLANRNAMFPVYLAGLTIDFMPEVQHFLGHPALTIQIQSGGEQLALIHVRALRHRSTALQHVVRDPEGRAHPGAAHPLEVLRRIALEVCQEPAQRLFENGLLGPR
jgi:hypothetical protein